MCSVSFDLTERQSRLLEKHVFSCTQYSASEHRQICFQICLTGQKNRAKSETNEIQNSGELVLKNPLHVFAHFTPIVWNAWGYLRSARAMKGPH